MKKRTKLLVMMLLGVLLSINQVWADEVVYNFSSFDSAQDVEFQDDDEIITIGLHKGEGSSSPAWSSNQARVYAKGYLVVSCDQPITSIVFAYVVNANKSGVTPTIDGVSGATNAGTWNAETKTWTGSDTEVTFSTSGSAGNVGFTSITVTYGSGTTYTDVLSKQKMLPYT